MKCFYLISLVSSCLIAGCASQPTYNYDGQTVDTTNLSSLMNVTATDVSANSLPSMGAIRFDAMKETATSLGAQAGLAWQAQQFNLSLNKNAAQLDKSFNFRELLIDNKVQPPILEQADQLVNLPDTASIRISDKTYKIVTQAKFVTAPLNWRDYLIMDYSKPALPDRTLLPRTPQEQQVWANSLQKGWDQGLDQAKTIYLDNLGRLKRDYNGMLLYRSLLAQNMVSKPYVAETDLGVTSNDDNSQIYINDKVLRITALPQLNPDSKKWRPLLTP